MYSYIIILHHRNAMSEEIVQLSGSLKYYLYFQVEKAFDAFNRNNLTLDWYPIPHFDSCINDPPGNCKEDFPK